MNSNFKIEKTIYLKSDGKLLDLHNNFDFIGFDYRIKDMTVFMHWKKTVGDWVGGDEIDGFDIIHSNVSYLKVLERDPGLPNTEDVCLASVTFYPKTDRDNNESLLERPIPNVDDDIIYCFQSDQIIRIGCEEINIIITNKSSAA